MNTLQFLREKKDHEIKYIREFFIKNSIKTVVEKTDEDSKRIIFNSNRSRSDFTNPQSFECNGLIADFNENTKEHNLLVVPPCNFNLSKLKRNNINSLYKKGVYNIFKSYDGTNVNLYYYKNKWIFSTTKGYEVNNLIFHNNKTYLEIITELLQKYPNFNYDLLDKNKCYSMIFKYYDYHPFVLGKKSNYEQFNQIVLLQSVNTTELNINNKLIVSYNDEIGLPIQELYVFKTNNINDIFNIANNAYAEYILYLKKNRADLYNINNTTMLTDKEQLINKKPSTNYTPIFGFILRSTDFKITNDYSNILIESSLLSNIRQTIYNHKLIINYKQNNSINNKDNTNYYNCKIENMNILNFNKLKSIITINKHYIFKSLYPQYYDELYNINQFLYNYLPHYILLNKDILINNINNVHNILDDKYKISTKLVDGNNIYNIDKLNKLAILLIIDINNNKLNLNVFEAKSIITDFIINMKYIYIFYKYIYVDSVIN